jgi:N-methylhydantoinase B/oxoprolinase/acetone carboxylase alpha subunit
MRPGDVYWYNDCYGSRGAVSHSNDQVLIAPVFSEGRLSAFVMAWAHFADIGGMRPGSISPDTTDIWQEGIIVPPMQLIAAGEANAAALDIFHRNSRYPAQSLGDMQALMASVDLGVRRVGEILARFGRATVEEVLERLLERTRRLVRRRLAETFPVGTYRDSEATLKPFLLADGIGVGYGARPTADGIDAVYFVAQENYPVEFLELGYPVRLRAYGVVTDSGGAGRFRGGCGIVREYEILAEEAMFGIRIDSVKNPPWGLAGGRGGGTGRVVVNPGMPQERALPPLSDGHKLRKGDVLRIETGGGGGHGHPFDRPPEAVLEDVLGGFVSEAAARAHYGVAIDGDSVDGAETARLRAARPATKAFHRNSYVDSLG